AEHGLIDSARVETQYLGEKKTYTLRRETKSKQDLEKEKAQEKRTAEKKVNDYVPFEDSYNRDFKFLDKDSTIAYVKVKSFSRSYSDKFYKEAFAKIKNSNASY